MHSPSFESCCSVSAHDVRLARRHVDLGAGPHVRLGDHQPDPPGAAGDDARPSRGSRTALRGRRRSASVHLAPAVEIEASSAVAGSVPAVDDERRGFLTGNLAYVLWGLLTLYWHELTGLDAFGLIALAHRLVGRRARRRCSRSCTAGPSCAAVLRGRADRCRHRRRDRARRSTGRPTCGASRTGASSTPRSATSSSPIGLVVAGRHVFHEQLRPARSSSRSCSAAVAVVVLAVGYGSPPYVRAADRRRRGRSTAC